MKQALLLIGLTCALLATSSWVFTQIRDLDNSQQNLIITQQEELNEITCQMYNLEINMALADIEILSESNSKKAKDMIVLVQRRIENLQEIARQDCGF